MTPTYKEKLKTLTNRIQNRIYVTDDDLDELRAYADDEIRRIRRDIEQNHELLDDGQTRENRKRLIVAYLYDIHSFLLFFYAVLKKHHQAYTHAPVGQWIEDDIYFAENTLSDLFDEVKEHLTFLVKIVVDYLPELARKREFTALMEAHKLAKEKRLTPIFTAEAMQILPLIFNKLDVAESPTMENVKNWFDWEPIATPAIKKNRIGEFAFVCNMLLGNEKIKNPVEKTPNKNTWFRLLLKNNTNLSKYNQLPDAKRQKEIESIINASFRPFFN